MRRVPERFIPRIDLLASISGVSFETVRDGAVETDIGGQRLLIIGLDELRANKGRRGVQKTRRTCGD